MEVDDSMTSFHDALPDLPADLARRFAHQSQLDFELDFFTGVLDRHPNYVEVLRIMATNLSAKGDYHKSVEIDRRLVVLCPTDQIAHYNLACSYSQLGQLDRSLDELKMAIEYGFDEFDYLQEDRDLESVRKDPRFKDLLQTYGIS